MSNTGSIPAPEDIIKATPLITAASGVAYDFDHSLHGQNDITYLGGHVLEDLWTPLEGRQSRTPGVSYDICQAYTKLDCNLSFIGL